MNSLVRPELPTAALRSSQATLAAVDNSAPLPNRPESTYKSGKVVQTTGATSTQDGKPSDVGIQTSRWLIEHLLQAEHPSALLSPALVCV